MFDHLYHCSDKNEHVVLTFRCHCVHACCLQSGLPTLSLPRWVVEIVLADKKQSYYLTISISLLYLLSLTNSKT